MRRHVHPLWIGLFALLLAPPALAQRGGGGRWRRAGTSAHPSIFLHPKRSKPGHLSVSAAKDAIDSGALEDTLFGRALRYALFDDKSAAAEAVKALIEGSVPDDVRRLGPWLVTNALAFDWVYGYAEFSPEQRKEAAALLESGIDRALALAGQLKAGPAIPEYVEFVCSAGIAALALYKERGGIKRLKQIHEGLFLRQIVPYQIRTDGARPEGPHAGVSRALTPILLYGWAYTSVIGQNLLEQLDKRGRGWVGRAGEWIVSATRPDGSMARQGDAPRTYNSRDGFRRLFLILRQVNGNPAFTLYDNRLKAWWGDGLDRGARWPQLDTLLRPLRTARGAQRTDGLGELFGSRTTGHYFGRSDWTTDAVFVRFNAGRFFHPQQHLDQGSFVIFRQAALAADQGWTEGGDAALARYARTSLAHSVLRLVPPGGGSGEQARDKKGTGGRITHFRRFKAGDAIVADLTACYPQAGLDRYVRQLVYLRPGTVVVLDTVKTREPGWQLIWQLQAGDRPILEKGKPLRVDRLSSRMTCRLLLPEGVEPRLVAKQLEAKAEKKKERKSRAFWRAEYHTTTAGTETTLIAVLQAHDRNKPLPAPTLTHTDRKLHLVVGKQEVTLDASGRGAPKIRRAR